MRSISLALLGLVAACLCSCHFPATAMLVRVFTDFDWESAAPQLTDLQLSVWTAAVSGDAGAGLVLQQSLRLGRGTGRYALPGSFVVSAPRGVGEPVTVEVLGLRNGAEVVRTRAITQLVARRTLALDLFLAQRCVREASSCAASQSCGFAGCEPLERVSLPSIDPSAACSPSGAGTAADPAVLCTCEQLQAMRTQPTRSYALGADVDCTGSSGWNGGLGFEPVGAGMAPFTGTFDGRGHTVVGLVSNRPSAAQVGLFGLLQGARVTRVGLLSPALTGHDTVGALAGFATQGTVLDQVFATGVRVSGSTGSSGGLVGTLSNGAGASTLSNCYVTGALTGGAYLGGVTAGNGVVTNCYSNVTVSSTARVIGGIVAELNGATVQHVFAAGVATGTTEVGGVAGRTCPCTGGPNTLTDAWWFRAGGATPCISTNEPSCMLASSLSQFYSRANAPLSAWDFNSVWRERPNDLPVLRWQSP